MTNKTRIMLVWAALGTAIAVVFNVVHAASGGMWAVSVAATLIAIAAARAIYWRMISRMMNHSAVVPTEHGPDGRIDAIELFWRPG